MNPSDNLDQSPAFPASGKRKSERLHPLAITFPTSQRRRTICKGTVHDLEERRRQRYSFHRTIDQLGNWERIVNRPERHRKVIPDAFPALGIRFPSRPEEISSDQRRPRGAVPHTSAPAGAE